MQEANSNQSYSGESHTLTLPVSGLTVVLSRHRFKVKDNEKAVLMCGDKKTNTRIAAAKMFMRLKNVDGSPILMEDILEWWEDDFNAVNELWGAEDFLLTPTKSSSSSPTSPAGD